MSAVIEGMRIQHGDRLTFFEETADLNVIATTAKEKAPSLRGLSGPAEAGSVLVRLEIENEGIDVVIVEPGREYNSEPEQPGRRYTSPETIDDAIFVLTQVRDQLRAMGQQPKNPYWKPDGCPRWCTQHEQVDGADKSSLTHSREWPNLPDEDVLVLYQLTRDGGAQEPVVAMADMTMTLTIAEARRYHAALTQVLECAGDVEEASRD